MNFNSSTPGNVVIVFLGNVRNGEFEQILDCGFQMCLLRDLNSNRACAEHSQLNCVNVEMNADAIAPFLERLKSKFNLVVLIALRESYVALAATLREKFELLGLKPRDASFCLDKALLKMRLESTPAAEYLARYKMVNNPSQVDEFMSQIEGSAVVKPSNLASSLFVARVQKEDAVRGFQKCLTATQERMQHSGSHLVDSVLMEEWLEGSLHSVEVLWNSHGDIRTTPPVDALTSAQVGGVGFQHCARYAPSALCEEKRRHLEHAAKVVAESLNFRNAVGHVEFIFTAFGPRLLEVGARPGGHRIEILEHAFGIFLLREHILDLVMEGRSASRTQNPKFGYGIVTPFPNRSGNCSGLLSTDAFKKSDSFFKCDERVPKTVATALDGGQSTISYTYRSDEPNEISPLIRRLSSLPPPFLIESNLS
ncbi:MAG: ATP-grasp domain-containing protein [Rhodocyclaceae bacterium]|nr:ATP-grasp domain-containing protein [Rhodocyclaceae bacterium]